MVIPLSLPGAFTVRILAIVASWNSYLLPLFLLSDNDLCTLPLGLQAFASQYSTDTACVLAFVSLSMIPALIFFSLFERRIIQRADQCCEGLMPSPMGSGPLPAVLGHHPVRCGRAEGAGMTRAGSSDHGSRPRIDDLILLEPQRYFPKVSFMGRVLDDFRGLRVKPVPFTRPSLLVNRFTLFRTSGRPLARQVLRGVSMTAPSDRSLSATYHDIAQLRGVAAGVAEHCANPAEFIALATLCNRLQRGLGARRTVDPYLVRVRDAHGATARDGARQAAAQLVELVDRFAVHLPDADLTDLDSVDADMLENILWHRGARWPAAMVPEVRRLSVDARPDYFFIPPRPAPG